MSVTQTLKSLNISTSTTHDVLLMVQNNIYAINEGLHCSENLDNIIFRPNQVRNYNIEDQVDPDNYNRKLCIEVDDQLNNPLQVKEIFKKYFNRFDTNGRRAGISDCVDMSRSTLIMSRF